MSLTPSTTAKVLNIGAADETVTFFEDATGQAGVHTMVAPAATALSADTMQLSGYSWSSKAYADQDLATLAELKAEVAEIRAVLAALGLINA